MEKWVEKRYLRRKRNPKWTAYLRILRKVVKITKGLKTLKNKRDEFLLCLTNPYRNGDPEEKETGPDSIKTMSIPLNF
jgi:hypothetical protein